MSAVLCKPFYVISIVAWNDLWKYINSLEGPAVNNAIGTLGGVLGSGFRNESNRSCLYNWHMCAVSKAVIHSNFPLTLIVTSPVVFMQYRWNLSSKLIGMWFSM